MRSVTLSLMIVAAAVSNGAALPADALPIDPGWSLDPVWDDGLAEVARYDAHRIVYGVDRSFETTLITVKEEFDAARAVKADPPYAGRSLVTVLKLNILSRIDTGNYPYDYMTSVFVRRDDPRRLVKLSQSSQEWCGTTFKEVVTWDGPPRLHYHSYFDGQADGSAPLPLSGGEMPEEQLILTARAASLERDRRYPVAVYDSLITNGVKAPVARAALLIDAADEDVVTGAGRLSARRLELHPASGEGGPLMRIWIERAGRRALLKLETADGRSLLLKEIVRRNYWSR